MADPIQQLSIDLAVLTEQVSAIKESVDRIDEALTQNGLVEKITKTEMRVEGLETAKTWAFWILGAVMIGLIINLLGLKIR